MFDFLLRFHQATSHYLNQWWLVYWRIYAPPGLNRSNSATCLNACCANYTIYFFGNNKARYMKMLSNMLLVVQTTLKSLTLLQIYIHALDHLFYTKHEMMRISQTSIYRFYLWTYIDIKPVRNDIHIHLKYVITHPWHDIASAGVQLITIEAMA